MMCSELKVLTYAAVIARKLATVHHLKVPINKEPTWLADNINRWLANVRNYQHPEGVTMSAMEAELVGFNFEQEIVDMFAMLAEVESPIVFSHNDLQEGNILLPSDDANISLGTSAKHFSRNMVKQFENHIVFIDFEFCSYNHRGFDIGNHFCERMFDYSNPEWPHFYHYPDEWPNDEAKLFFIREYLKQSKQLSHNEKLDTEQHVLKEADFYTLAAHLMWTLWSINNARTSKISFGYLVSVDGCVVVVILMSSMSPPGVRPESPRGVPPAQGSPEGQIQPASVATKCDQSSGPIRECQGVPVCA